MPICTQAGQEILGKKGPSQKSQKQPRKIFHRQTSAACLVAPPKWVVPCSRWPLMPFRNGPHPARREARSTHASFSPFGPPHAPLLQRPLVRPPGWEELRGPGGVQTQAAAPRAQEASCSLSHQGAGLRLGPRVRGGVLRPGILLRSLETQCNQPLVPQLSCYRDARSCLCPSSERETGP